MRIAMEPDYTGGFAARARVAWRNPRFAASVLAVLIWCGALVDSLSY